MKRCTRCRINSSIPASESPCSEPRSNLCKCVPCNISSSRNLHESETIITLSRKPKDGHSDKQVGSKHKHAKINKYTKTCLEKITL